MPWPYALLHGVVAGVLGGVAFLAGRGRPRVARAIAAGILAAGVPLQALLAAHPWALARATGWADVVFFAEAWLHLAAVLLAAGVQAQPAERPGVRRRTAALGAVAVGLAAATLPWRAPADLGLGAGFVDPDGVVRQSLHTTCAPAAAATLVRALAVDPRATERDLAAHCLTDLRLGTSELGLYRGLRLAAPDREVEVLKLDLAGLRALGRPALLVVRLERTRARDPALFATLRDECGWIEDVPHAVVWFGAAPARAGEATGYAVIGDPSAGLERWRFDHLAALWTGVALTVRGG